MEETELERTLKQALAHLNIRIKEEQASIEALQVKLVPNLSAKKYAEYSLEMARSEGAVEELKRLNLFLAALAGPN